jgi:hypothetical protein
MQLTKPEIEKMKQILSNFEDDESFEEFINRHDQIFLVIEIKPKTQQEDTLLLFKKMYKSSKLKKRYVISPFKQNTEFKILKGGKDFVLDLNYDFIFILRKELDPNLIYQENRCLIMNRKSFEDFFDLLVHYSNAFNQLKTVVDFIDWGDKYTEDLGRKCYKLMNSQVFNDCVVRFRKDVLENPDSELVEFLKKKEIQIQRDKTSFMIVPNSLPNLKRLLKILEDGFVKTYLLERTGLVGDFEGPNG